MVFAFYTIKNIHTMKLLSRGIAQKQAHHKLFVQGSETSHHWLIEKKKKMLKWGEASLNVLHILYIFLISHFYLNSS